jgi:hypothetical protein
MTTALLAELGERMKTGRILHHEYCIDLERNVYSWRIVAITHRLGKSFLRAPAFFTRTKRPQRNARGRLSTAI